MSFLVGICIIYALMNWIPDLLSIVFPQTIADLYANSVDPALLQSLPNVYIVVVIYMDVFTGVFRFGEALYTLTYIRNKRVEYRSISEAFTFYFKTLGLFLVQLVIITFWSMFFVIPGVIAAINFSQAFYILADNPDKGITRVLAESKMMMIGNRMNYVRLLVYYIPYMLLGYIPGIVIAAVFQSFSITGVAVLIANMLMQIPIFLVNGLICLGRATFYELLICGSFANFRFAGQDAFREGENLTI